MRRSGGIWIAAAAMAAGLLLAGVGEAAPEAAEPEPGMVRLNFPENVELKVLIDYVGKRRGVNFIYDENIARLRVSINAPEPIPADSLMTLLESALKMRGVVMSSTGVEGMRRLEMGRPVTATSTGPGAPPETHPEARPTLATTRVFELEHATPERVGHVLKPFFAAKTANITAMTEHDFVIITDYAANMKRLEELLHVVDRPRREVDTRFISVTNLDAATMAEKVTALLVARDRTRGAAKPSPDTVAVLADHRTNQVVLVGQPAEVVRTAELVESLDVPLGLETRIYAFVMVSPDRVDRLTKELIGDVAANRLYTSAADTEANLLVVTTTPEVHEKVESLRLKLDRPLAEAQNPIRFYKLKNAKATDVLETLRSLEGEAGLGDVRIDGAAAKTGDAERLVIEGPKPKQVNRPAGAGDRTPGGGSITVGDARIMADEGSNTLIVVAEPSMHPVYEKLIKRLDVRRPQVLIEATIVTLDTTDGFSLGVEFSETHGVSGHEGRWLTFSSFGLSGVDPVDGSFTLRPGIGFNGAVLGADVANVVIRALESDDRAKVVARPSVLINDNATGTLVSEIEEPFASVNASNTVATTSFAGYSSAGTKIEVTPQISEGDHLKLEYEVVLSSFADNGTDVLPPSRQTNSLVSEATFPDGHSIVVGGLSRENVTQRVDRLPLLGRIPGLEYLFSNRTKETRETTLFVFIRAVILRDDKFEDLKAVSREAAGRARLDEQYPDSEPVEIR